MVRALLSMPCLAQRQFGRRGLGRHLRDRARHVLVLLLAVIAGCAIVPRSRMDDCQKLTQSLRADVARLKDRVLALQGQNRDYAERAVDDAQRLAVQEEAIDRLEHSVQAYQDERTRLEAAYKRLVANLGAAKQEGADPGGESGLPRGPDEPSGTPSSTRVSRNSASTDEDKPR